LCNLIGRESQRPPENALHDLQGKPVDFHLKFPLGLLGLPLQVDSGFLDPGPSLLPGLLD